MLLATIQINMKQLPKDCGYNQRFRHDVNMLDHGVPAECIEWCERHCEGRWGWWFDPSKDYDPLLHNYEEQEAYMSFQLKRDAVRFWFENIKVMSEAQER